jgi:hypothetical protein
MLQQQKDNSRILTFVKLFSTIGLLKPLTNLLFVPSVLSTLQAPHESHIFHTGTPAKVSLRERKRERDIQTKRERERATHRARRDSRDEISATALLPRETHTKAQSSYFYFYLFIYLWRKSAKKSPMKTYKVNRPFWKISKKKRNRHIYIYIRIYLIGWF